MSIDIKYIGMDVHKEAISMAVLDGTGKLGFQKNWSYIAGVTITEPGCCRGPAILPLSCAPWGTAVHQRQ